MAIRLPSFINVLTGLVTSLSSSDVLAPLAWTYVSASGAIAINGCYAANSTAGPVTLTLPAIAGLTVGSSTTVSDAGHQAPTNNITVAANGSDTMDGYATPNNTATILNAGGSLTFIVCPGPVWRSVTGT